MSRIQKAYIPPASNRDIQENNLEDLTSVIQGQINDVYSVAHDHGIFGNNNPNKRNTVPTAQDGVPGDMYGQVFINANGTKTFKIYYKFPAPDNWKSFTLI
jgi:hypothetical protein